MAEIDKNNPINEEVDVEEEAVVTFPEEGEEQEQPQPQDFFSNVADTIDERALKQLASDLITFPTAPPIITSPSFKDAA